MGKQNLIVRSLDAKKRTWAHSQQASKQCVLLVKLYARLAKLCAHVKLYLHAFTAFLSGCFRYKLIGVTNYTIDYYSLNNTIYTARSRSRSRSALVVELIQLNVSLLGLRPLGATQCAARLERVSVIATQTPVIVVADVAVVVGQCCHIVVVAVAAAEGSPARRIAMHHGQPRYAIAQGQSRRRGSGCRTGRHIVIQGQRVMRIVVYVAGIGNHRIARFGIDGSIVIEMILGEPNAGMAIGKGLAIVRQGALLHMHEPWQGCIQAQTGLAIRQQPHVLLRVMRGTRCGCSCTTRLRIVGHVVDVAELGEGSMCIDHVGQHLQLLQDCAVCCCCCCR